MDIDPDEHDWESVIWFLLANNLQISNAHERRLKELKSTIETMDTEVAALMESYVKLYKAKRILREGNPNYASDPKWQVLGKELDRVIENFKQRVKATGG
jgi:hypothetical protein